MPDQDTVDNILAVKKQVSNLQAGVGASSAPPSAYMADATTDLLNDTVEATSPFAFQVNAAGTTAPRASQSQHPGIVRISSSANANSGAVLATPGQSSSVLISGGEIAEIVFNLVSSTNTQEHFGFFDNSLSATVDGAYINIAGLTLNGKTINNSVSSTTATSYTLSLSAWYRTAVVVNTNATQVDFYLRDSNGMLLWNDSLTTNIPTAVGRETYVGWTAFKTNAGGVGLVDIDWVSYRNVNVLTR